MAQSPTSTTTGAAGASAPRRDSRFEPLAAGAPVAIDRNACLRLRTHLAECRACAVACPVQAIQAGRLSLGLRPGCLGCGRCQAACPTGALAVEGFDAAPWRPQREGGERRVECARSASAGGDALVVPCLGGLSEARLLALCAGASAAPLVLVDRGGCERCPSGGSEHPARATLHRVTTLMTDAGVPAARLPRLERRPADAQRRGGADREPPQGPARRAFFDALLRPAVELRPTACAPSSSAPSPARQQAIAALRTLAAHHGGRLPASMFHRIEVDSRCHGHRVCASACPTGALVRWRDDAAARMGLAFDATDCIGCGHCVAVCPEQALQLRWGGGVVDGGRRLLSTFVQRECPGCGSRFAAKDGAEQTHCERCRKSVNLARSAFQTLFGARPKTPGTGVTSKEEL